MDRRKTQFAKKKIVSISKDYCGSEISVAFLAADQSGNVDHSVLIRRYTSVPVALISETWLERARCSQRQKIDDALPDDPVTFDPQMQPVLGGRCDCA